jgi:hypothetical protein
MRITRLGLLLVVISASGGALRAQIVTYAFGSVATPTTSATTVAENLSAGAFAGNLGSPSTGSGNPVYTAGSGDGYFTASNWTGPAPGTNYFEFTLTPNSGYGLTVTSLSFGYRATATGPTAFVLRSSSDSFAANLAVGTITNDSSWRSSGPLSITLSGLTGATTLRLSGSGASSSLGTLRIDDVTLEGAVTAVPEPAAFAAIIGALTLAGVVFRRRKGRPAA